jgi:hypothetical protein
MALIQAFGPQALEMLSGQMAGGPSPGQTGPNPNAGPSKFSLGIKEGMNIPNNEAPGGGFGLGLKSVGLGAGGAGGAGGTGGWPDDPDWIGPPEPFGGDITVTGDMPFDDTFGRVPGPGGEGGGGGDGGGGGGGDGGGKPGGGLPPWFEKLAAGAQVGEALGQKAPPPPALPNAQFDMENSLMQWLQSIGRR